MGGEHQRGRNGSIIDSPGGAAIHAQHLARDGSCLDRDQIQNRVSDFLGFDQAPDGDSFDLLAQQLFQRNAFASWVAMALPMP